MVYSNDDTDDTIKFFQNKYKRQPVTTQSIREFGDNYESSEAILLLLLFENLADMPMKTSISSQWEVFFALNPLNV